MALTTAYLGDVALAAPPRPGAGGGATAGLRVHVERFFAHALRPRTRSPARRIGDRAGAHAGHGLPQRSAARMGPGRRRLRPPAAEPTAPRAPRPAARRRAASRPTIAALLSDDLRGIVAWSEQRGSETSVYIDRSGHGVRFGAPELLERFQDPDGLPSPAASPTLVRLSSESVMLAWAGVGRRALGGAHGPREPQRGWQSSSTIAAPGADALLADLTAGPGDDALRAVDRAAARRRGRAGHGPPGALRGARHRRLPAGAHRVRRTRTGGAAGARAATPPPRFDPDSDRAVAVWRGRRRRDRILDRASQARP